MVIRPKAYRHGYESDQLKFRHMVVQMKILINRIVCAAMNGSFCAFLMFILGLRSSAEIHAGMIVGGLIVGVAFVRIGAGTK